MPADAAPRRAEPSRACAWTAASVAGAEQLLGHVVRERRIGHRGGRAADGQAGAARQLRPDAAAARRAQDRRGRRAVRARAPASNVMSSGSTSCGLARVGIVGASGSSISDSIAGEIHAREPPAGSGVGAGRAAGTICGESARVRRARSGDHRRDLARKAAAGVGRPALPAWGGAAGFGAATGAVDASSSAMICRMDERISSIDGSLVAGLFIETPLSTGRKAHSPQIALDSSLNTLTAERDLREAQRLASRGRSSPKTFGNGGAGTPGRRRPGRSSAQSSARSSCQTSSTLAM